jgi:hypothetical protein
MKLSTLTDEIRESKDAALVLGHDCGPFSPVKMKKRGSQSFQVILRRCSNYTLHSILIVHNTLHQVSCNKGKRSNKAIEVCEACKRLTKIVASLLEWEGTQLSIMRLPSFQIIWREYRC